MAVSNDPLVMRISLLAQADSADALPLLSLRSIAFAYQVASIYEPLKINQVMSTVREGLTSR